MLWAPVETSLRDAKLYFKDIDEVILLPLGFPICAYQHCGAWVNQFASKSNKKV